MKILDIKQPEQLSPPYQVPARNKKHIWTAFMLLLFIYLSGRQVEFSFSNLFIGLPNMWDLIVKMFPPNWSYVQIVTQPILETVRMAILGTTFGAFLALPVALCSARNVFQTKLVTVPFRFFLNLIRTVPDLLLASIFVAVFGIGPIAGILALTGFSLGIIAKLFYESVESIDKGPLEAMTAVGANKLKWITFGVVPQVLPQFVSYVLYTLEINVRAAAVLGLVGAGGIGLFYEKTLGFFEYDKTSTIIIYTLVVVLLIDYISSRLREKLI